MSIFTTPLNQPKVHFSQYIRTNNQDDTDTTKPSNPTETDKPTTLTTE